jgi:hypothetical protein
MDRFAALIIASAVASTPAQAQTAIRISGTVAKLDGDLVALSLSRGISLVVRLDSEPRVNSVAKGSGSDLKEGLCNATRERPWLIASLQYGR